ncbi:hypothetical protein GA0115252_13445, partial [Streptomyces sp. DfronAA-171]
MTREPYESGREPGPDAREAGSYEAGPPPT